MGRLRHLRELKGIAEEDEISSAGAYGKRVGQRHLTCLVDDEVVERAIEFCPCEQPGGASDESVSASDERANVVPVFDQRLAKSRAVVALGASAVLLEASPSGA